MPLLTPEIRDFVNRTKLGFIATVSADGTPNLSPKGTTIAWDDNHLAFADIHSPGTIANLRVNPAIEINIVDVFIRRGFRFKGRAEVLENGRSFDLLLEHYGKAQTPYTIRHVVLVKVEQVIPVYSPAYDFYPETEIRKKWTDYWNSLYPDHEKVN